ncbi:hypothetical protein DFJ63DRAFT_337465 [Scheffersomyces coipomensis]|uniref:uncharacterized protein n=1 Tax=Scheffersomyces coipomensis TaxID=1788519 RepID=UPI00315D03EE
MPNSKIVNPARPVDPPQPTTISITSPSPSPSINPKSNESSTNTKLPTLSGISNINNPTLSSLSNRKHRPKSLNLSQTDSNSDVALRIVSPGLPPLNHEMKSTMIKSQKIELQQRHLIASINSSTTISSSPLSGSGGEERSSPVVISTSTTSATPTAPPSTNTSNATAAKTTNDTANGSNSATVAFNSTKRNLTQMADELDLKLNAKNSNESNGGRLKRSKVPTPLNLNSSLNSNHNLAPIIHSAPIRPHNHPYNQQPVRQSIPSQAQLQQQRQQQHQQQRATSFARQRSIISQHQDRNLAVRRLPPTIQRVQYVPMPNTQVTYSNFVPQHIPTGYYPAPSPYVGSNGIYPQPRRYDVPYTSVGSHFPRVGRYFQTPTARYPYHPYGEHEVVDVDEVDNESEEDDEDDDDDEDDEDDDDDEGKVSKSVSVTDVYRDEVSVAAPLASQPLSAQREHFNREEIEKGHPHQEGSGDENHADEGDLNDDEDANGDDEIERKKSEQQHQYYYYQQRQHLGNNKSKKSTTSSRLNHSSSINNQIEAIKNGEIFGSINLMNESVFNFRIFKNSPNSTTASDQPTPAVPRSNISSSTDPIPSPESQWISKEKAKFLKICETSWDKFVASKFPAAFVKPGSSSTSKSTITTNSTVQPTTGATSSTTIPVPAITKSDNTPSSA